MGVALMVASYVLFTLGGTAIFMMACLAVGYQPFGAVGWFGTQTTLREGSVHRVWQWLLHDPWLPAACALGGVVVIRVLELAGVPRNVRRTLGGALFGAITLVVVVAGNWEFGLGTGPVIAALILGVLFGSVVLPRRRPGVPSHG